MCETPGCKSIAQLQCPTCRKLGIQGSFFCTQECFKGSWKTHKIIHSLASKWGPIRLCSGVRFHCRLFNIYCCRGGGCWWSEGWVQPVAVVRVHWDSEAVPAWSEADGPSSHRAAGLCGSPDRVPGVGARGEGLGADQGAGRWGDRGHEGVLPAWTRGVGWSCQVIDDIHWKIHTDEVAYSQYCGHVFFSHQRSFIIIIYLPFLLWCMHLVYPVHYNIVLKTGLINPTTMKTSTSPAVVSIWQTSNVVIWICNPKYSFYVC